MGLRERVTKVIRSGLAVLEALEAGPSGYAERRMESLERRIGQIEEDTRRRATSRRTHPPAPSPDLVG